jgi:hypothetical protein
MNSALRVLEDSLDWLDQHYKEYRFFMEHDMGCTLQVRLMDGIANSLPYHQAHCNHAILVDQRNCLAHIGLLGNTTTVRSAADLKYEPD